MMSFETLIETLSPEEAYRKEQRYRIVKRSVDARQRKLKVTLTILADENGRPIMKDVPLPLYAPPQWQDVHSSAKVVHIVGGGPAGLFAALTCIEHGVKPILYERGKAVSERKKDIALINRNVSLNGESNYCFGEGGAGTFSDGKLFSRSKKRGNMQRVMELFHYFGAPDTVLYETHAHIGSDKLPAIIRSMRECILAHGGDVHFEHRVDSAELAAMQATGAVIVAIGHSAHDTYEELYGMGVAMQPKGFAMGVRAEFPQRLINRLMYHLPEGDEQLLQYVGNATYSLVTQVNERGVYSFCMCPGGHIVPASGTSGACVVNGMSASHRNSVYANSGMVVQINTEDIPMLLRETNQAYACLDGSDARLSEPLLVRLAVHSERLAAGEAHALSGMYLQEGVEHLAYLHGAPTAVAPAQRITDFVHGVRSASLPSCSYLPGVRSSRVDKWLPPFISTRLQQGFRDFDRKYKGLLTPEAVLLAVESRSSSAVRIVRDADRLCSLSHPHIYPCGEGAGYAGGITSSALDGIRAAESAIMCL